MPARVGADWIRDAVAQYERPLVSYAFRMLRDRGRAQDVVQDAFLRLCDQSTASRRQIADHLAEWLYTVVRNRAVDVLRKESRMAPLTEAGEKFERSRELRPGEQMELDETQQQVLDAIDALPDNQSECIRLKFQGGLRYKEIARITGLTGSYIGWLIHTGLKTVRKQLAETEDRLAGDRRSPRAQM